MTNQHSVWTNDRYGSTYFSLLTLSANITLTKKNYVNILEHIQSQRDEGMTITVYIFEREQPEENLNEENYESE